MKKILSTLSMLLIAIHFSGCSVYMAAKQPPKKNLGVLNSGISRDVVIAEFGMPIGSDTNSDGEKVETYKFVQGYSSGVKVSRAIFHGLADLLTLFLWELIATPAEAIIDGKDMMVKVTFDSENRVKNINYLQN